MHSSRFFFFRGWSQQLNSKNWNEELVLHYYVLETSYSYQRTFYIWHVSCIDMTVFLFHWPLSQKWLHFFKYPLFNFYFWMKRLKFLETLCLGLFQNVFCTLHIFSFPHSLVHLIFLRPCWTGQERTNLTILSLRWRWQRHGLSEIYTWSSHTPFVSFSFMVYILLPLLLPYFWISPCVSLLTIRIKFALVHEVNVDGS